MTSQNARLAPADASTAPSPGVSPWTARNSPATPATPSPRPCSPTAASPSATPLRGPAPRHHVRRRGGIQRPGQDRPPVPGPRGRVHAPRHHRHPGGRPEGRTAQRTGPLDPEEDRAEYDKKYVHTDVLVVGGGPAGLAAAREAVRTGARVMLLDDQPELGGSLLSGSTAPDLAETIEGKPPWNGWRTSKPNCLRRRVHRPEPHHRLRCLRRQLRHRRPEPHRPPVQPRRSKPPASGSGTSAPTRWSWPPAPTNARWSSRTTTAPASCSPRPSAATSTATPWPPAARGHQHHQRQRLRPGRRPACRRRQGRRCVDARAKLATWPQPPSKPAPGC